MSETLYEVKYCVADGAHIGEKCQNLTIVVRELMDDRAKNLKIKWVTKANSADGFFVVCAERDKA